ncbi:hypothetical protein HPY28_19325 [Brevibacillus sp. HB1.2]|uniref:hypothetical protein n=1 Tax=Brevibacillus sp. HB1.2 TaxID=2738807 RepID=UPI0015764694|nr:hypothetical protein [Brevibacillus sp. HB1.2]NTU22477.1 hypothetical protein [Brevibacillus sp. HB1.2]
MNEAITRSLDTSKGKNIKKLIDKCHQLYDLCSINILDQKQAKKVIGTNQEEFDILVTILTSNEPISKLFPFDRVERTKKYEETLKKITDFLKKERNSQTRKSNAATKEFEERSHKMLMMASKKSLVKLIINNLPSSKIEKAIKIIEKHQRKKKKPNEPESDD